jgi:dTDP-4-amino-4,6-dideoxygalactose transaminase
MDAIMSLADKYGLFVIEDAAQGMMSSWRGRPLGSIGHFGAYSFHGTKNFTSGGEGGVLLVNDARFIERAEVVREKGTNRSAFMRGEVERYSWQEVGSSYVISEVQAACLRAQLQQAEHVSSVRRGLWDRYAEAFIELELAGLLRLPTVPEGCHFNGHVFYLLMPSFDQREAFIAALAERGITAVSHYEPLHSSPAGKRWGRFHGEDRHTSLIAKRVVRLPIYYDLGEEAQSRIISAVKLILSSEF